MALLVQNGSPYRAHGRGSGSSRVCSWPWWGNCSWTFTNLIKSLDSQYIGNVKEKISGQKYVTVMARSVIHVTVVPVIEKNWPGVGKIITWAVTLDEEPEVSRSVDFDAEIVEQLVSVFSDGDAEFDDVVATENVPQRFRKRFELIQEEQKQSFQFKLL